MKRFESLSPLNAEDKLERTTSSTVIGGEDTDDECFGRSTQKEFEQLLDFYFQEKLKENPPIDGIFSPEEELEKIKKLPKEEKKEALLIFKEKLAKQQEALADLRLFIEESIEVDHDIPKDRLMMVIERFSSRYGFNEYQKQISEEIINRYFVNRQKVLDIRQQFPNDHELVKKLTGINIDENEDIFVSVGPMTIDIETDALNAGRLYEGLENPIVSFKHGGFAAKSVGNNPVYYIVINQDESVRKALNDPVGDKTRKHEYEHQKNDLFRKVFEYQKNPSILYGYEKEQDSEIKKILLQNFFTASRKRVFEEVKDEILSSLRSMSLLTLQRQLEHFFFSGNGSYDYLDYLRNWEVFKDDSFYQETAQQVLVDEYRTIIQKAVDSYAELVQKSGYSTQKASALLINKPLESWPKTIKRFLNEKGF